MFRLLNSNAGGSLAPSAGVLEIASPARIFAPQSPIIPLTPRPVAYGKSLYINGQKFRPFGVAYGALATESGYPDRDQVNRDFTAMAKSGINTIRTYSVPPRWVLDAAQEHGLMALIGTAWEQHVAFLETRSRVADINRRVRSEVQRCAKHPALLGFCVGNEVPADIVRWYGHRRVEQFLNQLVGAVKSEDPEALVTYANYPSTEYLSVAAADFVTFNLYLERHRDLEAYLARLQNVVGDRPLVLGELGLDSLSNGEELQAAVLSKQLQCAGRAGCAGTFIFSWTDEWRRGDCDVTDWAFGLTRRDRAPKPALAAATAALAAGPFPTDRVWPEFSVLVCTHNGSRTIEQCLQGIAALNYPNYEVIVVDDGSTDQTPEIVKHYDVRLIRTANDGLSSARNRALAAANGEYVAYIDDDAIPDPDWLSHLADTFLTSNHAGVGGPNIPPPGGNMVAEAVANSPGGPAHVLLTDSEAEHIPGCNMAFHRKRLIAVGGFDKQFRIAGDDVDICWKLTRAGETLGFNPVAVVWHHRRTTIRGFWRQQWNYAKAEGDLERKWPEKYNSTGHISWTGRLYSRLPFSGRMRIYHGIWGSGLFQPRHERNHSFFPAMLSFPEFYLATLIVAAMSLVAAVVQRSFWPLWFVSFLAIPVVQAISRAWKCPVNKPRSSIQVLQLRLLTAWMNVLQPLARLLGRLTAGLTPWRRRGMGHGFTFPWPQRFENWNENWQSASQRLRTLESALEQQGCAIARGGEYDRWDLEVRGGLLGAARLIAVVEEHQKGTQLVRFRVWPRCWVGLIGSICAITIIIAAWKHHLAHENVIFVIAGLIILRAAYECSAAMGAIVKCLPGETQSGDASEITLELVEAKRLSVVRSVVEDAVDPLGEDLEITAST
jgi:O-antigen biosynthesis protein